MKPWNLTSRGEKYSDDNFYCKQVNDLEARNCSKSNLKYKDLDPSKLKSVHC